MSFPLYPNAIGQTGVDQCEGNHLLITSPGGEIKQSPPGLIPPICLIHPRAAAVAL